MTTLHELEQYVRKLNGGRHESSKPTPDNGASKRDKRPTGAVPVRPAARALNSATGPKSVALFRPLGYEVPGVVAELQQPSSMACWATTFTMLISWRDQASYAIETALSLVGQKWVDLFKANTGSTAEQEAELFAAAGLAAEPLASYLPEAWEGMLRQYGPLAVIVDVDPGEKRAMHVVLVTGIHGDGSAAATTIHLVDPGVGQKRRLTLDAFLQQYEQGAARRTASGRHNQIIHWAKDVKFAGAGTSASAQSAAFGNGRPSLSGALYGTGEHVLSGEVDTGLFNAATERLDVHGVPFSYAELIAMADLYETYDDMVKADPSELRKLQALIQKSLRFYAARVHGSGGGTNPTDTEWQDSTGKRYLKLAEDNFAHFAPSNRGLASPVRNHKSMWEDYHRRAITVARAGTNDTQLMEALTINAFGDHFLTDAFAAGHLFNKDDINTLFKSKVLSNGKVNSAGDGFFLAVAMLSFNGAVLKAFSEYETVESHGIWFIRFHPNINTWNRFSKLLVAIMERKPDVLGSSVVALAIHDTLNTRSGGLAVINKAGQGWNLTGDTTLNKENLAVMQKAVTQSILNVYDSVSSPVALPDLFKKVWDYVPQPTAGSAAVIQKLVNTYTDPGSKDLIKATAKIIGEHYDKILDRLVTEGYLRKA